MSAEITKRTMYCGFCSFGVHIAGKMFGSSKLESYANFCQPGKPNLRQVVLIFKLEDLCLHHPC